MLPPEVSAHTTSNAERRLFGKIRQELPDEWVVLHSLGLAKHQRKIWGEIDFVFVGPAGVFCIEVKGGRVRREEGKWIFVDGAGRRSEKSEGPFAQVGSASAALRRHLQGAVKDLRPIVGYGVMMPDITFNLTGPDVEPAVLYDERHVSEGIEGYVERLSVHWTEWNSQRGRRVQDGLSAIERDRIVSSIRADFDFRPSLRARIGEVNEELLRMTEQQYRVLDGLADNPRVIVRGGAGTGKTVLAVEEAVRAASRGTEVLLCCFNRALARQLSAALSDQDHITVSSLHALAVKAVRRAKMEDRLPEASADDLMSVFYPNVAVDALIELGEAETIDMLIVDEAQDLLQERYLQIFETLLRGGLEEGSWRFFYDPNQDIFAQTGTKILAGLVDLAPAQYRLTVNCRNAEPIGIATSFLSGVDPDETLEVSGPDVEYIWYQDASDAVKKLAKHLNRLLSGGVSPAQITLLSPFTLEKSCVGSSLPGVPFSIVDLTKADAAPGDKDIRFSTIGAFKGMESDVVVLCDVLNLSDEDSLSGIYVATSRARAVLTVLLSDSVRDDYDERAREFGRRLAEASRA